jgi:hypothetical protein
MVISADIKILKYVSKHPGVTRTEIEKKFGSLARFENLFMSDYIRGEGEGADSRFFVADMGRAELETRKWFTGSYVIRSILIPIALSIISTLITIFLSAWLSTCL